MSPESVEIHYRKPPNLTVRDALLIFGQHEKHCASHLSTSELRQFCDCYFGTCLAWYAMPYPNGPEPLAASSPPAPAEFCICAAVLMPDGYIVRGHRHSDAMQTAGGIPRYEKMRGMPQGFVTSLGRFVDREEGARLQIAAGIESADKAQPYLNGELYSEDLY